MLLKMYGRLAGTILLFASLGTSVGQTPAKLLPSSIVFSITPPSGSVKPGDAVVLTAIVTSGGVPVRHGVVVFCDATVANCRDSAVLGQTQLTGNGKAAVHLKFGAGSYNLRAIFQGTSGSKPPIAPASSDAKSLKVSFPSF